MRQELVIPKGWTQMSEHCFIDKKGDPHIRTKKEFKLTVTKREKVKKKAQKHSEKYRKTTQKWRKKKGNKKKIDEYNAWYNKIYSSCVRRATKFRLRKLQDQGMSNRCAKLAHKSCKNRSQQCTCRCHKNT